MKLDHFGFDEGVVMGRVVEVHPNITERADRLLVEDRSHPTYPNMVACEFFGDRNRALLTGVAVGDLVRVVGAMRSKPYKDKWYTNYSCFSLTIMGNLRTPEPGQHREETVGDRDSERLPF